MKTEEFVRLEADIRWASMSRGRLSDQEAEFVDDLLDMAMGYGRHMHITERQSSWLARILEKLDE